jgi:hypothetical protein
LGAVEITSVHGTLFRTVSQFSGMMDDPELRG